MKKFVLVHGWDGGPDKDWFPWLRKELEHRGFEVVAPQLPSPEDPRKERWVPTLHEAVGIPDENTYFVVHSMGCQALARYLEALSEGVRVGGAVFVAGFFKSLVNLENAEAEEIAASWLDTPLDLAKVKSHLHKSIYFLSDDDQWVGEENIPGFRDGLGAEIILEHGKQHYNEAEYPQILDAALRLAQN